MKKEEIQVDIPDKNDVEEKEVEKIESKVEERLARKREQVEKLFIEHYNQEEGSEALKKLVDREMASGKSFDKLIKQKKKWRTEATKKKKTDVEEDDDDDINEKNEKNSLEKLQAIEKSKATKSFLQGLIDKYPDNFKTKEDVMEAHKKIEREYKETGDETRREDFEENLKKAFRLSHPDLYEQDIRDKARKELLEDDVDLSDVTNKVKGEKNQKKKPIFLKPKMSKDELKDWLVKG